MSCVKKVEMAVQTNVVR